MLITNYVMLEMIKGKICWIERDELERVSPETPIDDFSDISEWYDVLEEHLLEQGFVLEDEHEDITFIKEWTENRKVYFKYNIGIVKTHRFHDKYKVDAIGIKYVSIKNSSMKDLDKLVYSRNHLRAHTVNGTVEEDGAKAFKLLDEVIEKMKTMGIHNLKQLTK